MASLSRRSLLKGGLAGTAALGFNFFGFSRAFAQSDDDVQTVLNLAATAELFATTHYLAAINGDLGLAEAQINYLKTGFLAEQDHLELLVSLGAEPVVTEFYVPENLFSDRALFAATTEVAETTFVAAYLAATRIFSALGEVAFAVTTAQIAPVEAEHRALARQIGELVPNNTPYGQYLYRNVSDAVPTLQPFLDGSGEGFVGPVTPPTADDIAAVRAEAEALGYDRGVQTFAAIAAMTAEMAGTTCTLTNSGSLTVNIRSGPSTDFDVANTVTPGNSIMVDGQTTGANGRVWFRLADGSGWIRSDTVMGMSECMALPVVNP